MRVAFSFFVAGGLAVSATASSGGVVSGQSVDHGQLGQTWPVAEPDLLSVIKARLDHAAATGKLDQMNRQFAEKAQSAPSCDFGQVGERFGNVAFGIDDGNHRRGQFAPS